MNWLKKFWQAEPILAGIIGNALFWPTLFGLLQAAGHKVDPSTQNLIVGMAGLLTASAVRNTVTAPDTLKQQMADIHKVNA